MTGTRNPSRKYFKRNQPYFYKSVDNWEEWDTDESYNRTFFIGVDDSNQEDINVTLYMIWGGKPVAVVGSRVLDTVSSVVDTARLLEEEIQSILEEVQELTVAVAQARIDIEEAIIEIGVLVDRCEGILEGAEAARDLAMDWATKIDGMVEEEGEPVDYSAKYYAYAAKDSESAASDDADLAEAWATKMDETVDGSEYSSKYYADQSAGSAATAVTKAGEASDSATLASKWATQLTTPVGGGEYSAKQYAQNAGTSATNASGSASVASGSATAASNSATLAQEWAAKMDGLVDGTDYSSKYYAGQSATSAQDAQDALDNVNGLIATPIGTVFQSIYVDEALDIARQLNGQLIPSTKFYGFRVWLDTVQAYNPNLFTTESNWQAEITNSKLGQCGKFVIDDTAGTIRLPKVVNAQGLQDLALMGGIKAESLPNITGNPAGYLTSASGTPTGAFTGNTSSGNGNVYPGATSRSANFDASRSSSTYQDNAPVQQEAIQYPYYIQVATGVEETLPAIREYEINTPFFFGQSMYSESAPYNASWLASNGQWNASSVYPDFWTQLNGVELNGSLNVGDTIEINGKTYVKRGLPVELSTDTYTDYDFVVNQNNQTFRLPLIAERVLVAKKEATTEDHRWYNLYSDGWIEQGGYSFPATSTVSFLKQFSDNNYTLLTQPCDKAATSNTASYMSTFNHTVSGFSALANLSITGYEWQACGYAPIPTQADFTEAAGLYYYVGDTVQDASLINAGAVLGQLATKTNFVEAAAASMPSNRYIDLTLGASGSTYTAPANGWVSLAKKTTAANQFIFLGQLPNRTNVVSHSPVSGGYCQTFIAVRKGDTFFAEYTAGGEVALFRFTYAEGDQ